MMLKYVIKPFRAQISFFTFRTTSLLSCSLKHTQVNGEIERGKINFLYKLLPSLFAIKANGIVNNTRSKHKATKDAFSTLFLFLIFSHFRSLS